MNAATLSTLEPTEGLTSPAWVPPADVQPTGPDPADAAWWAAETRAEPSPIRWPKSRATTLRDEDLMPNGIG